MRLTDYRPLNDAQAYADLQAVYWACADPDTVALVIDDSADSLVYDWAYSWQAAQNFALSEGRPVVAIRPDGHMAAADIARLCAAELERYRDCFAVVQDPGTLKLVADRRTCHYNEIFGTVCNTCGYQDWDPDSPQACTACGSTDLDSAGGCEFPHDAYTRTLELVGTVQELARWCAERGLSEWDGGGTVYRAYGLDYSPTGEVEELTVSGPHATLAAVLQCDPADYADAEPLSDWGLY